MNIAQTQYVRPAKHLPWSLAAFSFLVCYFRSFVLLHTPILLWGDALGYATKGQRLLTGELPYRDFFDFIPPGTEFVYAVLFHLFGVSLWIPNLLMCALAAAVAFTLTWLARSLLSSGFVPMPALLLAGFILWGSLDATHHWFSTLCAMGAVAALWNHSTLRATVLAGALCGLTASFTQSKGATLLCALLVYMWYKHHSQPTQLRARAIQLCTAAFLVFAIINGPFILAAGPHIWFADMIIFPFRYFGSVTANNWHGTVPDFTVRPGLLKWLCVPFLYLAVPIAYLWALVRVIPQPQSPRKDKVLLLALAGISISLAVLSAPSTRRLACASPPAILLLVWLLSTSSQRARTLAKILAALSFAVACAQVAAVQRHPHYPVSLPAGNVVLLDPQIADVYRTVSARIAPGQWFFGLPPLTLPLKLRNPTPVESPTPGDYTRPDQIAAIIAGLKRTHPRVLILRKASYLPHFMGYRADHLEPFQTYLFAHYSHTATFASEDEVWEEVTQPRDIHRR